jgi:dTDP-4-amino-4,6-dideoxygalactose transaminase
VEDVLRSGKVNYWTGPRGMEFEKRYAAWQGSKFAISTTNGAAVSHVALSALGVGPGDEVIVPRCTFSATSFADVKQEDHRISVASAEKLVTKRTKAIIAVHLYGDLCDMDPVMAFARKPARDRGQCRGFRR